MNRKDLVIMKIVQELESLSGCSRASVGCVIVDHRYHLMSTGYNGQAAFTDAYCDGCPGACGCVHAEANALIQMRKDGHGDHKLFCTYSPCIHCAGLIINTGDITKVIFKIKYRKRVGLELLEKAGIRYDCVSE